MASEQCEALTNSGARCKRAAKVTLRSSWQEKFLFFFHRDVEVFDHFCDQHAASAKVGEVVE
jgi:hypothetical protein